MSLGRSQVSACFTALHDLARSLAMFKDRVTFQLCHTNALFLAAGPFCYVYCKCRSLALPRVSELHLC